MSVPHGGVRAGLALLGAGLAAIATWKTLAPPPPPERPVPARIVEAKGGTKTLMEGDVPAGSVDLESDLPIREGDLITAPAGSPVRIRFVDGSLLVFDPLDSQGVFQVESLYLDAKRLEIEVRAGRVSLAATPGMSWKLEVDNFVNQSDPSLEMEGIGGTVALTYEPTKSSHATVQTGSTRVKYRFMEDPVDLGEGFQLRAVPEGQKAAPSEADPDELESLAALTKALEVK